MTYTERLAPILCDYLPMTLCYSCMTNFTNLITNISGKFTQLYDWCISNKLTIMIKLNLYFFVQLTNQCHQTLIKLILARVINIARVKTFQYLGIYFDETMKWNEHVTFICNSLVKYFGIFNHIKNRVTRPIIRQLYSFIYSKINYGVEMYGNTSTKTYLKSRLYRTNY